MNLRNTYSILILAAALMGGSALAWHQYQELVGLRAASLSPDERANLKRQLGEAYALIRALKERLGRLTPADDAKGEAEAGPDSARETEERKAARRERQAEIQARMKATLASPEFQGLQAIVQKGQVDGRYAAFFKSMNLSPAQLDQLTTLLVDRQNVFMDVRNAMAAQGIDQQSDPKGFGQALSSAFSDVNDQIKAALGDAGYAQLQQFDRTQPQRATVSQLSQSLGYTSSPLTDQQTSQLVQILAQNPVPRTEPSGPTNITGINGVMIGGNGALPIPSPGGGITFGVPISPQAVNLAAGVLTASQLQALQQMQQDQQTAQQLGKSLQQQVQQLRANNPPAAPPAKSGSG